MSADENPLSKREQEILTLVARGLTNQEIARELVISHNTVKVHLRNIFAKLEVVSRTEAIVKAAQAGWIDVAGIEEQTDEAAVPALLPSALPSLARWQRVYFFLAAALVLLALVTVALLALFWYLVNRTALGRAQRACEQDRKMAALLARGFGEEGFSVASGLARGIDAAAHRGALSAGGRTIAVLGSGVLNIYPPEHAKLAEEVAAQGALLSESPPRAAPLPGVFPQRNRVISGLTLGTIVVVLHGRTPFGIRPTGPTQRRPTHHRLRARFASAPAGNS